jgi:alkanesulfonate monooxygenase SsuD/methylene tetrahydromethanopterin reductase-like flavin-dependent oxidoreductase (luciferase family)
VTSLSFGLNVAPDVEDGGDVVGAARLAESLGFDFVSMNDHVHGPHPRVEAWTALSWIAAGTTRVRVLPRVLGVPYRHPAMLAKMAETFDRLSGGRLILGLGAGASEEEFDALGLGTRRPSERLQGLEEAIQILRGLWTEPRFTFAGRSYRTHRADIEPKPARRIPVWLGTFGERALALTGRVADGWIPSMSLAPPDRVTAMRDRVLMAAESAGRNAEEMTLAYNLVVHVGESSREAPGADVAGRAGVVIELLQHMAALGFGAFNFITAGPDHGEQAERLARDVIPAVRGTG